MGAAVTPIAVVGMACRLPGAPGVEQFWGNLAAGRESITFFDRERLRAAGVPRRLLDNPDYVGAAPRMPDADRFDADLFGLAAREAELTDPQMRAFLEVAHAAIEDAGYDPFAMADSVGVFGTTNHNEYLEQAAQARPDLVTPATSMSVATHNHTTYLSTFVSHALDLRGPSITVLTACSGSLVAAHLAAQALRAGECDAALAGGAVLELPLGHGYLRTPGSIFSADGHCRPFDAAASGTIFGSGAGAVLLKRLDDAVAAGDDIRAVILGSAVNNDGADKVSFSAPSVGGQAAAVAEAMALAGVSPEQVDYVEAHATGTALGDPVEVAALAEAYRSLGGAALPAGTVALGSVKSNIGHLAAVAGMAGLIKTVLMLEREAIAPTVNLTALNPRLELEKTPFHVPTSTRPWPRRPERPRIAGVSSLGIGGTNAHLVVTEAPAPPVAPPAGGRRPRVVVWSGRSAEAHGALRGDLAAYFGGRGGRGFADAVATLQHGRTAHPVRGAAVCRTAADAAATLGGERGTVHIGTARPGAGVALLFPGQGAQRARMAIGLYGTERAFSVAMDECLELLEEPGAPLYDAWHGDEPATDPRVVQPLLFAVEYALARMWHAWGVRPVAVLGHSVGELVAATVAGVFTLPEAARLVTARGEAMARYPVEGAMVAVSASVTELAPALSAPVAVAAVNGERRTVLSGPAGELERRLAHLPSRRVAVSHAFHHPGWHAAAERFAAAFEGIVPRPPAIALYSGRTGARVGAEQVRDPWFWAGQLLHPVLFWPALDALVEGAGRPLLVEAGPGRTLTSLARRHPAVERGETAAVPTLPTDGAGAEQALDAAARLWTLGAPVDWEGAGQPPPLRRARVPGYPYQRRRYWIDPAPEPVPSDRATTVEWRLTPAATTAPRLAGTALVLLPAGRERAAQALAAVRRGGLTPVPVRPGAGPAEVDGGFEARAGEPADVDRVLDILAARGELPGALVHATTLDPLPAPAPDTVDGQLRLAFGGLLALARRALRYPPGPPPRLHVLTARSVDVTGGEPVSPAAATLHGLVRTLRMEEPRCPAGVVDVGERVPPAAIARELAAAEESVALRGNRRWLPVERAFPVAEGARTALRHQGVYLVTGGFGGLGTALARGLARAGGEPRLVLLGRRDPTAAGAPDGARERAEATLAELRAHGAEVLCLAADVTDRAAVEAALASARARFGPVNGVFHLAGVAGDRMLAFREPADADAVLAPKAAGAVHLAAALAGSPQLDFTVYFSSRAGTDGLVGGGDYAAANAFLDAMATAGGARGRVLSVGWPVWRGPGMVDHSGPDLAGLARRITALHGAAPELVWEAELSPASEWMLDEHRLDRRPVLPGTGYLDLLVRWYRAHAAPEGATIVLSDVLFRAAYAGNRPRVLRASLRPVGGGHEFVLASRPAGEPQAGWTDHVTGTVATAAAAEERLDLAGLRQRLALAGEDVLGSAGGGPLVFGPRWDNFVAGWSEGEATLVELALPAPFADDVRDHPLHPALLDRAIAAVRGPGERAYLPFHIQRLTVYGPLPARVAAYVTRRPERAGTALGDVTVADQDGRVLATVEGFAMRGFDASAAPRAAQPAAEPAVVPAAVPERGLDPEDGVRLLLDLLDAETPPVVLVPPHAGETAPPEAPPAPAPAARPAPAQAATVAPPEPGDLAGRLAALWRQVLGTAPAGDEDDFFDAGGDSLSAVELMARIRADFGAELTVGLLLETRTYGGLRDLLAGTGR